MMPSCMLIDLLHELILELIRALFLEELCQRVKERLVQRVHGRRIRRGQELLRWLHIRHRDRLLHRLTTEPPKKL
jgi:hypothetical protein